MSKFYTDLEDLTTSQYVDSRDLMEALADYDDETEDEGVNEDDRALREQIKEEYGELAEQVREAGEGITDWIYGATLIREDHFIEYAQEFAEDTGAIPDDASWPATCIDWEKAADELRMDFTSVELNGNTFYVR